LRAVYGDQIPWHTAPHIDKGLGGYGPLNGISAYLCQDSHQQHGHFVTYGFSELGYNPEACGQQQSGRGFEMTLRWRWTKQPVSGPYWASMLLQTFGMTVNTANLTYRPGDFVNLRSSICFATPCDLTAVVIVEDPVLRTIDTPHGRVTFLQLFGITTAEANSIENGETTAADVIEKHRAHNPLLITELDVPEFGTAVPSAEDLTQNVHRPSDSAYEISQRVCEN
jgi:hypothetical protein